MSVYYVLAKSAIQKNMIYVWAHMATNVGSALFGLIYITFWQAASHGRAVGGFSVSQLVLYIAVGQMMLWVTTFLPRELGVTQHIRTGQIALELARPLGYFPRTLAQGLGEVVYNVAFRSLPLGLVFVLLHDLWLPEANVMHVVTVSISVFMGAIVGLCMQYLIGLSAFWTIETSWARRIFLALVTFCGGQLLPIPLMPALLQHVLVLLPFQTMISFPILVWLGTATVFEWCSSILWCVGLLVLCSVLTAFANRRLEVQGG